MCARNIIIIAVSVYMLSLYNRLVQMVVRVVQTACVT